VTNQPTALSPAPSTSHPAHAALEGPEPNASSGAPNQNAGVFVQPETRHATSSAARVALALTVLVLLGVLVQGVLAGDFYGGAHPRAVDVHKALGPALLGPALLVVVICAARLRVAAAGRRALTAAAGTTLALVVEAALGFGSDQHPGLLVLHIPIALGLFAMLSRQVVVLRAIARPAEPARR
jgi:hypothetical protein